MRKTNWGKNVRKKSEDKNVRETFENKMRNNVWKKMRKMFSVRDILRKKSFEGKNCWQKNEEKNGEKSVIKRVSTKRFVGTNFWEENFKKNYSEFIWRLHLHFYCNEFSKWLPPCTKSGRSRFEIPVLMVWYIPLFVKTSSSRAYNTWCFDGTLSK